MKSNHSSGGIDISLLEIRINAGLTRKQLAEVFGVPIRQIYSVTRKYREQLQANAYLHRSLISKQIEAGKVAAANIKKAEVLAAVLAEKKRRKLEKESQRLEKYEPIRQQFIQGKTLQEIANQLCVSRERVRQILKLFGITGKDGGRSVSNRNKSFQRSIKVPANAVRMGLTREQYQEVKSQGLIRVYTQHRKNAERRGIEWNFTVWSWYTTWKESGHLNERGRSSGSYVMARHNDSGPYSPENVSIKTCNENGKEAVQQWAGKKKDVRGVFRILAGTSRPYLAKVGKKRLGMFASVEEAVAARNSYIGSLVSGPSSKTPTGQVGVSINH